MLAIGTSMRKELSLRLVLREIRTRSFTFILFLATRPEIRKMTTLVPKLPMPFKKKKKKKKQQPKPEY
jgi:hypothetical protein